MSESNSPGELLSGLDNERYAKELPPVDQWNPDFCGDIDMRIARDGAWYYLGTPITRPRLVKLFAGILKKEDDKYFLVTPVEKVGIKVDDAPFVAISLEVSYKEGIQLLTFETNVGDKVIADREHPITVLIDEKTQEPAPYIIVRRNLLARINRNVFYQLIDLGEEVADGEQTRLIVKSSQQEYVIGSY